MDNNIIDKRTKGEWDFGYGDNSKSFGIFTKKMLDEGLLESPICLISPIDKMNDEDKANAAFIVKACNEYERLIDEETRRISAEVAMEIIAEEIDKLRKANRELLEALKDARTTLILANLIDKSNTCEKSLKVVEEAIKKHSPIV